MNVFIECPKCATEFIVTEDISAARMRCPDCLQWVNSVDDYSDSDYVSSYAASYVDDRFSLYEERGYQAGYDY
jgi:predicted Zn finger-like uncharacterized protein